LPTSPSQRYAEHVKVTPEPSFVKVPGQNTDRGEHARIDLLNMLEETDLMVVNHQIPRTFDEVYHFGKKIVGKLPVVAYQRTANTGPLSSDLHIILRYNHFKAQP
jgi:hypothetical protein